MPLPPVPAARTGSEGFTTPMFPGAAEPGPLTTFGVVAVVVEGPAIAMDAATIAARQREGGGAPNQRRSATNRSPLEILWRRLRDAITGTQRR